MMDRLQPPLPSAVAVSGGPDSMALLHFVAGYARAKGHPLPVALTFDHGLRPTSRDEAMKVGAWARSLGVPHHILGHRESLPTTGIQAWARRARYDAMGKFCATNHLASLFIAHHRDDLIETATMRQTRSGAPSDGMAGVALLPNVAFAEVRLVRPLLFVPKAALIAFLDRIGQDFIQDPSNGDLRFERARVRAMSARVVNGMPEILRARAVRQENECTVRRLFDEQVERHEAGFFLVGRQAFVRNGHRVALSFLGELIARASGSSYRPAEAPLLRLLEVIKDAPRLAATLGRAMVRTASRHLGGAEIVMIGRETPRRPIIPVAAELAPLIWDGRFDTRVESDPTGLVIAPLGRRGVASLRGRGLVVTETLPAAVLAMTPALFDGDRLISAPGARFHTEETGPKLVAEFRGRPWLPYADFVQPDPPPVV